jgi:hypothetical protein
MAVGGGSRISHRMFCDIGAVQPSFGHGIPGGSTLRVARCACHSSAIIGMVAKRLCMIHWCAPAAYRPTAKKVNEEAAKSVPRPDNAVRRNSKRTCGQKGPAWADGWPLNNGRFFHSHGIQIVPRKGPPPMREETLAIYRMLQGGAFDDRAVKAMGMAYEAALRELRLSDRNDPRTDVIARKIIACAQGGELDPARLCELALEDARPAP